MNDQIIYLRNSFCWKKHNYFKMEKKSDYILFFLYENIHKNLTIQKHEDSAIVYNHSANNFYKLFSFIDLLLSNRMCVECHV